MADNVIQPFIEDMRKHGRYQYTGDKKSSRVAGRRQSDVIRDGISWEGKTVVDVGCGDGTNTALLRDETRALSILGIDPAEDAVQYARATHLPGRPGLDFKMAFSHELLAEGAQFDIAVYRGVIHHVADAAVEIRNAVALAKEVYFLEPNGWNPILKLLERFSTYHREHKEQSFRLGLLEKWVHDAGGEVVSVDIFGLVPFFCPDWMVNVCSALEPAVERIPALRMIACGQQGLYVRRKATG